MKSVTFRIIANLLYCGFPLPRLTRLIFSPSIPSQNKDQVASTPLASIMKISLSIDVSTCNEISNTSSHLLSKFQDHSLCIALVHLPPRTTFPWHSPMQLQEIQQLPFYHLNCPLRQCNNSPTVHPIYVFHSVFTMLSPPHCRQKMQSGCPLFRTPHSAHKDNPMLPTVINSPSLSYHGPSTIGVQHFSSTQGKWSLFTMYEVHTL